MTDRLLGRAAIGVVLAVALAIAVTALLLLEPGLKTFAGLDPAPPARYSVGDRLGLDAELFESSARTVFIFGRRTCGACRQAQPVFAEIIEKLKPKAGVRVVLMSMGESPEDALAYAGQLGVQPSDVHPLEDHTIPVPYVPTVIVADRSGTILLTSEGVPTEDRSHAIVTAAVPGLQASE